MTLNLDEWANLVRQGVPPELAAARFHVQLPSVYMAASRKGRDDVLDVYRAALRNMFPESKRAGKKVGPRKPAGVPSNDDLAAFDTLPHVPAREKTSFGRRSDHPGGEFVGSYLSSRGATTLTEDRAAALTVCALAADAAQALDVIVNVLGIDLGGLR